MQDFYDVFVCEEKDITASVDVTSRCTALPPTSSEPPGPPGPPGPPPPTKPIPIVYRKQYFPLVFKNDTGLSADRIYITVYGANLAVTSWSFYFLAPQGPLGQMDPSSLNANSYSPNYSYTLDKFPTVKDQTDLYLLYLPIGITSGRLVISIDHPAYLSVTVDPDTGNLTPNAPANGGANFQDPNFYVINDFVECTLTALGSVPPADIPVQPFLDNSQVDSMGISTLLGLYYIDESNTVQQFTESGINTTSLVGYTDTIEDIFSDYNTAYPSPDPWNNLLIPFYSDPYGAATPDFYFRLLAPKHSVTMTQPNSFANPYPSFPTDYLTNGTYSSTATSYLDQLFTYFGNASNTLYFEADPLFNGSGITYESSVSGSGSSAVLVFTGTGSNSSYYINIPRANMTVANMYSANTALAAPAGSSPGDSNPMSAIDITLLTGYFSSAFVVGLIGDSSIFDSTSNPLLQLTLQNHMPCYAAATCGSSPPPSCCSNAGAASPSYYNNTYFNPNYTWYSTYAAYLHSKAEIPQVLSTDSPYPPNAYNTGSAQFVPNLGLAYAFDYDDKLGVSSTVASSNTTPKTPVVFGMYTLNEISSANSATLYSSVFEDSTTYSLTFTVNPGYTLYYRQGSSGSYTQYTSGAVSMQSTTANPFQIKYVSGSNEEINITLFPKYQNAQPNVRYGQYESNFILGLTYTIGSPTTNITVVLNAFAG